MNLHRTFGRVPLLLLIAAWMLLRPLAAASPPDPTWIDGFYDDGDSDNVVILIGSLVGLSEAPESADTGLSLERGAVAPSGWSPPTSACPVTLPSRSPPQA